MSLKRDSKRGMPSSLKSSLTEQITDIFRRNPSELMNYKQISKQLGIVDNSNRQKVLDALHKMVISGVLSESDPGKFQLKNTECNIIGKVDMTAHGYAYVVSPDSAEDVFVSQKNLRQALHGDTVKVHLLARRKGQKNEGQVIEIMQRARESYVGTIGLTANFAFMIPDSRLIPYDMFIPPQYLHNAKDGEKVMVRIVEWPHRAKNPIAEVIEVLGLPGKNETEMHSILAEYELPYRFKKEIDEIAEGMSDIITDQEIAKRTDFRDVLTFTIDPADAKDFDDAISLRQLINGNWEIGIHIADVTHYIKPNSLLDQEAINRSTSVYLVDRVVPMLPEKLSNNLCSLRPNEDKLCFSAVFELDNEAIIHSQWFGRTIIRSVKAFSYEEAQAVIETGKGELSSEILQVHNLAQKIRKERFKNGSIAFDKVEPFFVLDKEGKPLSVSFKVNKESNQLIEEFMLLANRKVAEFCSGVRTEHIPARIGKGKVCVYRVHASPNMEKLETFASFVTRFGYSIKTTSERNIATSLNKLLDSVKGKKEQNMIETLALRSMAKADYSVDNIGHYGLGFKYYTHFTSPIRRYPDMMVHRLLQYYLEGGEKPQREVLETLCLQASKMEKRAVDAERASIKYKQVEFMSDKIGQLLDGVISGITEWGMYVELNDSKCEGMIHIRELNDDTYVFDEDNYCLKGRRRGRVFQLGDAIRIKVWKANLLKKQIDFLLAD